MLFGYFFIKRNCTNSHKDSKRRLKFETLTTGMF